MDCSKERAINAREIAEKMIQQNDFQGARNSAMAAQNIFPQLENISQLLAVCNVHCAAQMKVYGNDKDWYGILQVERMADEVAIKKQYRKLALLLHPDKNKFPGAEAAFKLIGEAHVELSDEKRRLAYDYKLRVLEAAAVRKKPPQQANRKPVVRKSHDAQNINPNMSTPYYSSVKTHQPNIPIYSPLAAFWRYCPTCRCQYLGGPSSKLSKCPNCSVAHNSGSTGGIPMPEQGNAGAQGTAPGSDRCKAADSQEKRCPEPVFKSGAESNGQFASSHVGSNVSSGTTLGSEKMKCTGVAANIDGNLKTKVKEGVNGGVGMSKKVYPDRVRESGISQGKKRRRAMKYSESCDMTSGSDSEEDRVFEESKGVPSASQTMGQDSVHSCRMSTRQKPKVSYNENVNDDDFMSTQEWHAERKYKDGKVEQNESFSNENLKGGIPVKENFPHGNGKAEKRPVNMEEEAVRGLPGAKNSSSMYDFKSELTSGCTSDPVSYQIECPDPEFNDFDSFKDENCLSVGQVWACFDSIDGMPRFYAVVRKFYSPGFKVRITWLEPVPEKQGDIDWVNEDLPVGCGKFKPGDTEETSDQLMFSHLVNFERVSSRGTYKIYPKKGETWALLKDWDIGWSSNPENHKSYEFEIVEILADFDHDTGIRVGLLEKIKGFVSLFQMSTQGGRAVSFLIPSNELLRFSHRILCFKMTGLERAGVPQGSFELDPASLPSSLNDIKI